MNATENRLLHVSTTVTARTVLPAGGPWLLTPQRGVAQLQKKIGVSAKSNARVDDDHEFLNPPIKNILALDIRQAVQRR